jgi:large subunit ribosomal protein L2
LAIQIIKIMGVKKYKPTSPGRRISSVDDFSDITAKKPLKKLTVAKKRKAGKNSSGKITVRHRGGGAKRRIRLIDFKQDKFDIPAKIEAIEYDPNRNARIARLLYKDGERRYIIAVDGIKVGDKILCSKKEIEIKKGNRMPIEFIPAGMFVNNVEIVPGKGGELARGAGAGIKVLGSEGKYAQIKLPSSEVRMIPRECLATVGIVSNPEYKNIRWGKAGRLRHRGFRPAVRGKAMNPADHPHGGGEGGAPIGLKGPKTPWGKYALGVKTRKKTKSSNKMIVKRRKTKRR